jgi:tRNA pseudouridine38-40 synthase
MARYQVILAYDGTAFCGFQRQGQDRTVQLVVEEALRQIGWQGKTIYAAGRTDTGVHASGQVIAFDLEWRHGLETLGKALNANLPEEVAVKQVELAENDHFHPRFDAHYRSYQYHIYGDMFRDPFLNRQAWRICPLPPLERLNKAARLLVGRHDFAAFGAPLKPGGGTERIVFSAGWVKEAANLIMFEVTANAFLYHMVRRMVFLQVQVAQEHLSLDEFKAAIEAQKAQVTGLAPSRGLFLTKVGFTRDVHLDE